MRTLLCSLVFGGLTMAPAFVAVGHAQSAANTDERKDALNDLKEATQVVQQMNKQPEAKQLIDRAKGVFLIPDYGRAALVVGGSGGEGVLLVRTGAGWSDPVFYNLGSISAGAQAGVTAGQLAMVLMTDRAVNSFKGQNTFSLNANAGLTIVNWSARGQASLGKADVVLWSDTEGLFGGASISVSDISADTEENQAYFGRNDTSPGGILSGKITRRTDESAALKDALSRRAARSTTRDNTNVRQAATGTSGTD